MNAFFSVVIPTLNEEKYLPHLLNDFKSQKEKNFEVIIADGNSEDSTREKAIIFKEYFSLYFYINERKNVAFQRNFAAQKARGIYLIFLDADSRVSPNFTHSLKRLILNKKGLVFIPYNKPDENNPQTKFVFQIINLLCEMSQSVGKPFSAMGMVWEKNFFNTVGGFDETLYIAEDHKIVQDARLWGVKAKFLPKVKVVFSLRRMKQEGKLILLYKYLLATGYILLKGNIKKKIFAYEMGGNVYTGSKTTFSLNNNIKKYISHIKDFFSQHLS